MADRQQLQELEAAFKSGNMHLAGLLLTRMRPVVVSSFRTRFPTLTIRGRIGKEVAMVSLVHLAAYWGWKDIAVCLVAVHNCSPMWKDEKGHVSLHYAAINGHLEVVKYFTAELHCYPMDRNKDNETPLHYACVDGHLNVVRYLISEVHCNPSCVDYYGSTPLHIACINGHLNIVQYLISELHCNPSCVDIVGTPLHSACYDNHTHIVQYLLSTGRVNPMAKNNSGKTPLSYATGKYDIIKLFQPFIDCSRDFPVHTFTKLILTGDSGAGKTTIAQLIKLLANRASSAVPVDCVTDVQRFTAGIIPNHAESEMGNFVMYDFAGQQEYYSSHAAVLQQVMRKSAAMFICMIDLSKGIDSISQSLHYWLTFINNACSTTEETSHVVIIGSHADQVTLKDVEEKSSVLKAIVTSRVKHQKSLGYVAMDCRRADTDSSRELISILSNSHKAITANQPSISYYCHVLYAFLHTKLGVVGIKLDDLMSAIASENDSSLPKDSSVLTELLSTLSDKGLILFMQHSQPKWVVVKTEVLLHEINGELFGPHSLKVYPDLASNTGVILASSLHKVFDQYNKEMLIGFLVSFDFCRPVDPSVLQYTNLQTTTPSHSTADLLFFPGLIQSERPDSLILRGTLQFGWCLGCLNEYHFLNSRFLHVLLLSVAYKFTLACRYSPSTSFTGMPMCTVWRNGIYWRNADNITTVVELINNNQWVVVAMSYVEGNQVNFAELRGSTISLIRHLQQEHCASVEVREFLISTDHVQQYPFDNLPCSTLFDIYQVARSILRRKPVVLSYKDGESHLKTQSIYFEPYQLLTPSYVCQLFNPNLSDQPVPASLLHEVRKFCGHAKMNPQVYKELREYLDSLSIFAGSNPLEVAQLKEEDLSSDSIATFGDPSSILTIADLSQVNMFLKNVNKWQSLGQELGLLYPTLKRIEEEQHGVIDKCRTEMLAAWLQQDDNTAKKIYPRWAVLKTALGNIGENNLKIEIEQAMTKFDSSPVDPKTVMESSKVTVTMRIIKIEAQGYPGTGKTSLLNLAMGEDPAPTRDSTGFVEPPSRYMVSETLGGKWKKLTTDKILEGIKKKVDELDNQQASVEHKQQSSSSFEDEVTPSPESVLSASTQALTEISQPSPQPLPSSSLQLQGSINVVTDITQPTLSQPKRYSAIVSELLRKVGNIKHSTEIFSLKWVIVSDCGGQPPFLDAAALFLRNSSLRIIPLKLSDRLEADADISYFVGGNNCLTDSYVPLTNQQTIETFARSVAATQPLCTPSTEGAKDGRTCRCKFTIIGTFKDNELKSEPVEKKEEILKKVLQPYKFFQICGDRFILPINAVVQPGPDRDKAAADLRKLIENSKIARDFKVKLCWFLFLLGMMNMAKEKKKAVLSIKDDECFELAESLGMEKHETIKVFKFFHDIGLMMHFDGDLADYVVVDDEPVLQKISQLLSVSFLKIDDFNKLYAPKNVAHKQSLKTFFSETSPGETLSSDIQQNLDDIQQNLKEYGRFHRRYLEFLNLTKKEVDFFLKMLVHINAIAETNNEEYFMPCALPYKEKPKRSNEFPWILKFRMKVERAGVSVDNSIPPPVGYLPILVVFLITKFSSEFTYPTCNERQHRNYITLAYKTRWRVYIIERHLQLEFYFSGGCKFEMEFANIRRSVLAAICKTEERLQIADGVERLDCFLCTCGRGSSLSSVPSCHVCVCHFDQENGYYAVCEESHQSRDVEPENLLWMKFAGPHPTDQTKPAAVTCPQQTESTGGHKQPAIDGTHGGDMNNQEETGLKEEAELKEEAGIKVEAGLKEEDLSTDTGSSHTSGTNDPSSILSIDDLAEIIMALKNFNNWLSLGLQLGLRYETLEKIEKEQHGLIDECKRKMLVAWLKRKDNKAVIGVPSWAVLKVALEKIDENQLASEINLEIKRRRRTPKLSPIVTHGCSWWIIVVLVMPVLLAAFYLLY